MPSASPDDADARSTRNAFLHEGCPLRGKWIGPGLATTLIDEAQQLGRPTGCRATTGNPGPLL